VRLAKGAAAGLLLLFVLQAALIAARSSNTWDEPTHIFTGYSYLVAGRDYLSPGNHPVLGRAIAAALPALFCRLHLDPAVQPDFVPGTNLFVSSVEFLYENSVPAARILLLARLGNVLLGALLGWFVFRWSSALWGWRGGLLSLFLYAFCPNMLANASLATTDLPITAFFFLAAYAFHRFADGGARPGAVAAAGVTLGLALASKITAVLLLPLLALACVRRARDGRPARAALDGALVLSLAWLTVWAVYGFRYHAAGPSYPGLPWERYADLPIRPLLDGFRGLKLLPESFLYGVAGAFRGVSTGKPAFLMGEISLTGWWYYFLVAFFIKTPLPAIILLAASFLTVARRGEERRQWLLLLAPALLVAVVVSAQHLNAGLRHVLPAYPFLFAAAGACARVPAAAARRAGAALGVLAAWYVAAAVFIFPHQLAYFNELVGGPKNGYRYLVDSNLDWGQDLGGLKEYLDRNGIRKVKLAYFGFTDPAYFGIDYDYLPSITVVHPRPFRPDAPLDGCIAISATLLQGVYLPQGDLYREFRALTPAAVIGYSIFVYRL
jgi:hypothetical protein